MSKCKVCGIQKEMSAVKHETKWIITNFNILLLLEKLTTRLPSQPVAVMPLVQNTQRKWRFIPARIEHRELLSTYTETPLLLNPLRFITGRKYVSLPPCGSVMTFQQQPPCFWLIEWYSSSMFVCFFPGTFSLFNLIKGCGRLKRDLTASSQCHQCRRPRAWCWKSARTSICRADRNEAPAAL